MKLNVYVLSDSLGNTGEKVAKACLAQFDYPDYEIKKYPHINIDILNNVLEDCKRENSIIIYSAVTKELSDKIKDFSKENNIAAFDIIGGIIDEISDRLKIEPIREAGIIRKMDVEYFRRVEAIEFAVKYDDGKDPRGFLLADIILLGISRTSKTPLSLYLANKNYKVANFPVVPNVPIPKELIKASPEKIFGLTISLDKVHAIRRERLKTLGFTSQSSYSDKESILEEIEYANEVIRKIGCPVIDVSNKAIEETGDVILSYINKDKED